MNSNFSQPSTPLPRQHDINQLLQDLNSVGNTSPSQQQSNITITPSQLDTMIRLLQHQASNNTPSSITASSSTLRLPDYHSLAKYEEIISRPIKPSYDGSSDGLIPFLNRLDIRRQDESWYPITFLQIAGKSYDIIRHFTEISESVVLAEAKARWTSPTLQQDKFDINHPTYQTRVLAKLLLASLTEDFCVTIVHRVNTTYRNDGLVILWTICNNVHRSNIAFTETIKAKIRNITLADFNTIDKYFINVKDSLSLITSSDAADATKHNDLIIYIFNQLTECSVAPFKHYISRLHVQYLEASLPDMTPVKLLQLAEDKICILRHANQWVETEESSLMALKAQMLQQKQDSDKTIQRLVAHVGRLAQRNLKRGPQDHNASPTNRYPAWMIQPPQPGQHTQLVNNRLYSWCTKCRKGQGLWVCRHTTDTHVDGFVPQRQTRQRTGDRPPTVYGSPPAYPYPPAPVQAFLNQSNVQPTDASNAQVSTPPAAVAQLSILDYLDAYCDPIVPPDEGQQYYDTNEYPA
jgi:hypothetical protein